jgi:hypothetical protein
MFRRAIPSGEPAGDNALEMRAYETIAHQRDHLLDGEAVHDHDRLGAAFAACGEQFEPAQTVRLGNGCRLSPALARGMLLLTSISPSR